MINRKLEAFLAKSTKRLKILFWGLAPPVAVLIGAAVVLISCDDDFSSIGKIVLAFLAVAGVALWLSIGACYRKSRHNLEDYRSKFEEK